MAHNQGGMNGIEAISGVQAPTTSAIEKIILQNYDSNPARANALQNQGQFLGLTGHRLQGDFSASTLNFKFNDGAGSVGMNPFFTPPPTATRVFTA